MMTVTLKIIRIVNNSNRADEEGMQISEEEEETAPVVYDEDNVKIFEENTTDEIDEETVNADDSDTDCEDEECVVSRKEIEYSAPPIPARRQMRNILTQSSKVIANPRDIESFELFLSEAILRTVLMHANRNARDIRRTLGRLQPFKTFSMDELKAGKSDVIGNDKKASERSTWVIKQKKEIYSSRFIFNHVNDICLVVYQAKKKNSRHVT